LCGLTVIDGGGVEEEEEEEEKNSVAPPPPLFLKGLDAATWSSLANGFFDFFFSGFMKKLAGEKFVFLGLRLRTVGLRRFASPNKRVGFFLACCCFCDRPPPPPAAFPRLDTGPNGLEVEVEVEATLPLLLWFLLPLLPPLLLLLPLFVAALLVAAFVVIAAAKGLVVAAAPPPPLPPLLLLLLLLKLFLLSLPLNLLLNETEQAVCVQWRTLYKKPKQALYSGSL